MYQALYRTLRPKNFNQVVGQEHIIKTLSNQLNANRVNHAYLFCGTRGTGKTSTAKIFAKVLNCEKPIDNIIPCDTCPMCVDFNQNRNFNVIEIDAASNNSVNNIRELKEEVKYPPTTGKYKVYIIDEVHMLTTEAFNALLKTLEEPPEYVIFILATTDTHKIPLTILSRTQRFDFKRISNNLIVKNMEYYIESQNIKIQEDALFYIAKISDGAMRDALSILEKCISFYINIDTNNNTNSDTNSDTKEEESQVITLKNILDLLGAVDDIVFFYFIDNLIEFEVGEIIDIIDGIVQEGRDISNFVNDVINHLRNLVIVKVSKNLDHNVILVSEEKLEALISQAKGIELEVITNLISYFLETQNMMKNSSDKRIILETNSIKICNSIKINGVGVNSGNSNPADLIDFQRKIEFLENRLEKVSNPIYIQNPQMSNYQIEDIKRTQKEREEAIQNKEEVLRELAVPEDIKVVIDNYKDFIDNNFKCPSKAFLIDTLPKSLEDEYLYITTDTKRKFYIEELKKLEGDIVKKLKEVYGKEYLIKIMSEEEYKELYKKKARTNSSLDKQIFDEFIEGEKNENATNDEMTNEDLEKISQILPSDIVQYD